jgi:GT2 family glycosyltransferase
VVAYESGDVLARCIDSLDGQADELVVVNNGGTLELERERVRLIEPGTNLGFGAGGNLGAAAVTSDVLVFLNPDTVAQPGAVQALAHALDDDTVGVVQARLRLLGDPDRLNSSGNVLHVSGLAWPGGYREPAETLSICTDIAYASGAAFAIRRALFEQIGGFTEELFLYQEDLELCWRVWLSGRRVVVTPDADVLHDYVVERPSRRKEYYLERNRLIFLVTAYSGRLLALAAPVILAVELGILVRAAQEGWLREKLRGWHWLVRHRAWLRRRRRTVQGSRAVPDSALARLLTPTVRLPMVDEPRGLAALNVFTAAWWRVVRVIL